MKRIIKALIKLIALIPFGCVMSNDEDVKSFQNFSSDEIENNLNYTLQDSILSTIDISKNVNGKIEIKNEMCDFQYNSEKFRIRIYCEHYMMDIIL